MSIYEKEHAEYFRLALDSMINQTVKPDEIVLVEDGPLTDELYAVVDKYKEKYKEIFNVVVNEKNLGLGLALNKGLIACRNELIARMDTDDIAISTRCEKQLKYFEEDLNISIVGCQIEEFIESPDKPIGRRLVPENDHEIKHFMKKRCPFNHMTVMFKKSAVLEAGNYQDWFWNEDYYLWIRMALKGHKFANLPETLVKVRVGKDMYARRGGDKYFKSEIGIQKLMLQHSIINLYTYLMNWIKRFIMQKLFPNTLREIVFKKFARKH